LMYYGQRRALNYFIANTIKVWPGNPKLTGVAGYCPVVDYIVFRLNAGRLKNAHGAFV